MSESERQRARDLADLGVVAQTFGPVRPDKLDREGLLHLSLLHARSYDVPWEPAEHAGAEGDPEA